LAPQSPTWQNAADGATLVAAIRMSGESDCATESYRNYFAAYSTDGGAHWALLAELPGVGCVSPRLLHVPGGVLSGGRNRVADTKGISLWASATGASGASWNEHSVTYQHNRLWRGIASFLFDARVNETDQWETLSYTSIVLTNPDSFAVFYNKFFAPRWPPWPSANFVMQGRVV
jgi:hypothetical protein